MTGGKASGDKVFPHTSFTNGKVGATALAGHGMVLADGIGPPTWAGAVV